MKELHIKVSDKYYQIIKELAKNNNQTINEIIIKFIENNCIEFLSKK